MPSKKDPYHHLAADLLKELAVLDAELLDDTSADLDQQEAARVKLVADFLRREAGVQEAGARPRVAPVSSRPPGG